MRDITFSETPIVGKTLALNVDKIICRDGAIQIELDDPSYSTIAEMGITEIKINDALFVLKEKLSETL